jgi:UDP-N-acetylmuramoylalanine--D-glutamate ligase
MSEAPATMSSPPNPALPVPAPSAPRTWADWPGRSALVVGLARSGLAAARLLAARGLPVTATDVRPAEALAAGGLDLGALAAAGVRVEAGRADTALLDAADVVVASPGVPPTAPLLAEADRRGVPVVAELELAFQASAAPWVAITGTNGKSTTTALAGRLLEAAGRTTWVCGNIGQAASERAREIPPDGVIVAEVSSFQLERVVSFRPAVAIVLNLTPDHLDRHGDLATYAALKARVFARQVAGDRAVLNADDPALADWPRRFGLAAQVAWFARGPRAAAIAGAEGAFVDADGNLVRVREGHRDVLLSSRALRIPGPHNVSNALAAVCATLGVRLDPPQAAAVGGALAAFPGLEHRIEHAGEVGGVTFWNDSKATNVDAMETALRAFPAPLVVIAGGRDKAGPWPSIAALAGERIGRLVLLGEAAATIEAAWPRVPAERAADLDDAVRRAWQAARALGGAPVVLSPGCASFDMFRDYEDRGRRFKAAVAALAASAAREGT